MEHDLASLFEHPERTLAALALLNPQALEPLSGFVLALQLVASRGALAGIPEESPFGELTFGDTDADEADEIDDESDDDFDDVDPLDERDGLDPTTPSAFDEADDSPIPRTPSTDTRIRGPR